MTEWEARPGTSAASRRTLLIALAGLPACSVTPTPITPEQTAARVAADRAAMYAGQGRPNAAISLEAALARSLIHNLDNRLAMYEQALQSAQLDVTRYDMLPRVLANAGYAARDRDLVSSSYSTANRAVFADRTISVDRERLYGDLTFSWNLLDFGASYYLAKQQSDRVLVARERRRRTVNAIFQEVRYAYWQAAAAQRLLPRVNLMVAEVRNARAQSRRLERNREMPLAEALRYQRTLIELNRQLDAVAADLATAKAKLAQLMGMPLGYEFELTAHESAEAALPEMRLTPDELERVALVNRPELREEDYNYRIAQLEGRRAILRMLPGLSLTGSFNGDSNSFLTYHNWAEVGLRTAVNLMGLVSAPAVRRQAQSQADLVRMRRLALSMSVVAQVHISVLQFNRARVQFGHSLDSARVERRLQRLATAGQEAEVTSEMERIRNKAASLVAELQCDRDYAEMQNAYAAVFVALGLDPLPDARAEDGVERTAEKVAEVQRAWLVGDITVPVLPTVDPELPPEPPAPQG